MKRPELEAKLETAFENADLDVQTRVFNLAVELLPNDALQKIADALGVKVSS